MPDTLTPEATNIHWLLERRLAVVYLVLTLLLATAGGLAGTIAVMATPGALVLGMPLGFFLAAVAIPVLFVLLTFVYARRQETVDEDFDAAED